MELFIKTHNLIQNNSKFHPISRLNIFLCIPQYLLLVQSLLQRPQHRILANILKVQDGSHSPLHQGGGVDKLIPVHGRGDHWDATVGRLRGAHESAVRHEHLDIRVTEDVPLGQPLHDVHIGRLIGQRVVLPLPDHLLLQPGHGPDDAIPLGGGQRVGADHGAPADEDHALFGIVQEALQVRRQGL